MPREDWYENDHLQPLEPPDPNKGLERRNRTYIRVTLKKVAKEVGVVTMTTEEHSPAVLLHAPSVVCRGWVVGVSIHMHIKHFINVDVCHILCELQRAARHLVNIREADNG